MEELRALLDVPVTAKHRELFVVQFIPAPPETLISDRVMKNVEDARQAVRNILASVTCEGIADSAYGLVEAAVEYCDHERNARSQGTRFKRSMLRIEPFKAQAKRLALEVAAV